MAASQSPTQSGGQTAPTVAANGVFLVAWTDLSVSGNANIFAGRVATNGSVSDPTGFSVSSATRDELLPALVKGKGNAWGVAYQRTSSGDERDMFFRTVSPK